MKNDVSSVSISGLSLEKIGITPSKDYSRNKNGTYTVDENKLLSALEKNTSEAIDIFVNKSENNNGILNQLIKYKELTEKNLDEINRQKRFKNRNG